MTRRDDERAAWWHRSVPVSHGPQAIRNWRVGGHYGIHVYEGDRPVATFHCESDAAQAVLEHNAAINHRAAS